jgi:hypothetical protein
MRRPLTALALLMALATVSRPAWAARAGVVDLQGTELREGPGLKYKILEKLAKGLPLAASNVPVEG